MKRNIIAKKVWLIWVLILLPVIVMSQNPYNFIVPPKQPPAGTPQNVARHISGPYYELTPDQANVVGALWNNLPFNLDFSFDRTFYLNFGTKDTFGADGIAFVLHQMDDPNLNPVQGCGGENIGYAGPARSPGSPTNWGTPVISPSVDVEFDTYYNGDGNNGFPYDTAVNSPPNFGSWDNEVDHIDIYRDGNNHGKVRISDKLVQASPTKINIEDGECHKVRLWWDATNNVLSIYFDGSLQLTLQKDLRTYFNFPYGQPKNVWWGFTAGTGATHNKQYLTYFYGKDNDTTICALHPVTFGENLPVDNGITYSWKTIPGNQTYEGRIFTDYPAVSTNYIVTMHYPDHCDISDTIKVTVNCTCKCTAPDIALDFDIATPTDPEKMCAYKLNVNTTLAACAIKHIKVLDLDNNEAILLDEDFDNGIIEPGKQGGVSFFELLKFSGNKNIKIILYGPNGAPLNCEITDVLPGCDCAGDCNKIIAEFGEVNTNNGECCRKITVKNLENSCIDIYRIVLLENGVQIKSKDFGNTPIKPGDPLFDWGNQCLPGVSGSRTITLRYEGTQHEKIDKELICDTTLTLKCPCDKCDGTGHPLELIPVKVDTGNPEECCFDLYVRNKTNCDVWTRDGLGFGLISSGTSSGDVITVKNNGQWNGFRIDRTMVRFSRTKEIIKAGTLEYIGTICIDPSISPIDLHSYILTKNSNVPGGYNICAEVGDLKLLDCNQPINPCCNYIDAYMVGDNSSAGSCICKFKINTMYGPGCEAASVTIIPISNGLVVSGQSILTSGTIATLCFNPPVSVTAGTETFTAKVKVIFYDAAGNILCVKELTQSCTHDFGSGGGGGGGQNPPTSGKRENTDHTLSPDKNSKEISSEFYCQPNPFTNETVFTYNLNQDATVTLELYDMQGKYLEQIENANKIAGEYNIKYINKRLKPGVYTARLTIGSIAKTIKVLIN